MELRHVLESRSQNLRVMRPKAVAGLMTEDETQSEGSRKNILFILFHKD
ncbi:hypothetical protein W909_02170 [Dickeya zeae EC1]|nr:hypothetical protein W909_02170 [Dickeya zeae EC1]